MIPALVTVLLVGGLVVGLWAAAAAALDRRVSGAQLIGAAVLELLLIAQAGISLVGLATGSREVEPVTFVGYWLTAVLLLPVGAFWAIGERSRWGNGVLSLTGFVVAVLVLRLQQIWTAGG
ncbi:MAG: hypothetical protein ACLGIV_09415 [Actinomycetes bacterium]